MLALHQIISDSWSDLVELGAVAEHFWCPRSPRYISAQRVRDKSHDIPDIPRSGCKGGHERGIDTRKIQPFLNRRNLDLSKQF
jgi:hypothetical protein